MRHTLSHYDGHRLAGWKLLAALAGWAIFLALSLWGARDMVEGAGSPYFRGLPAWPGWPGWM